MISSDEALDIVLSTAKKASTESIAIRYSIGRVLAMDVIADRDFPPFDRVTMDGIAILHSSLASEKAFQVESISAAGKAAQTLQDADNCIEVMTGAPKPKGTDTVIRYEDLTAEENAFKLNIVAVKGKNIHLQASDHEKGAVLLASGTTIKAIDVNILATVGISFVRVRTLPKVAVISSGDELVSVDSKPKDFQIRMSNVHMLQAKLQALQISADTYHLQDHSDEIKNKLKRIIGDYDVLLISGGVSKGKFDFMPEVLNKLGFAKLFHRVAQRPGKPLWFGAQGDKVVFAFPGNPVSTLACFHKYFVPWLHRVQGQESENCRVVLEEDVSFRPDLTYFAQASLMQESTGRLVAKVCKGNGSGDMVSPSMADGFIEFPPGKELYRSGELYNWLPF